MDRVRIDGVDDRRAHGAARLVRRAEHEVVDEQLRATVEELGERLRPRRGLEAVVLLDRHPGELPPLPRQLVAATGELLLLREQLLARCLPLLTGSDLVVRHHIASLGLSVLLSPMSQLGPRASATGSARQARMSAAPGRLEYDSTGRRP